MAAMLELVTANYRVNGQRLLDDLNIAIPPETFTAVLGPNGAGKTLFLRLCHKLIEPSSGIVRWVSANAPDDKRQHTKPVETVPLQTMVFQKPVMLRRSVLENIRYVLQGCPRRERTERAYQALQWGALESMAKRYAMNLSVGQQQQLALVRAWTMRPDVLFLDEPTANLDPAATERVEGLITEMHRSGTKILMATHHLAQTNRMADEVVFINEGTINCYQPTSEFFSSPKTHKAEQFISREVLRN